MQRRDSGPMKLLLTGGTGFFGKALLRHWAAQAARGEVCGEVTVLSRAPGDFLERFPEFRQQTWLSFHEGDILVPDTLPTRGAFTHILHAAADSTFGARLAPVERYDQIVDGTRHLLNYAVRRGVQRFLLTSSGGVYGPQPPDLNYIPESHNGMPDPLNPAHAYSVAKRCAEHLCALYRYQHGLETVIARCFAFVGRDLPLDVHFAIGNFIRDALNSDAIGVSGDGSAIRSYMDQRDLAVWLLVLLERGQAGQAYNVGSDEEIGIGELANLVRDVLAPTKPVKIAGKADAGNFRTRYVPSIEKAQRELGLRLAFPLKEAVLETARHARGHAPTC
jgi:UDP-glucuronate decarboxylase